MNRLITAVWAIWFAQLVQIVLLSVLAFEKCPGVLE